MGSPRARPNLSLAQPALGQPAPIAIDQIAFSPFTDRQGCGPRTIVPATAPEYLWRKIAAQRGMAVGFMHLDVGTLIHCAGSRLYPDPNTTFRQHVLFSAFFIAKETHRGNQRQRLQPESSRRCEK